MNSSQLSKFSTPDLVRELAGRINAATYRAYRDLFNDVDQRIAAEEFFQHAAGNDLPIFNARNI